MDEFFPVTIQSQFVFGNGNVHLVTADGVSGFQFMSVDGIQLVIKHSFFWASGVEKLQMDTWKDAQSDLFIETDRNENGEIQPVVTPFPAQFAKPPGKLAKAVGMVIEQGKQAGHLLYLGYTKRETLSKNYPKFRNDKAGLRWSFLLPEDTGSFLKREGIVLFSGGMVWRLFRRLNHMSSYWPG